MNQLPGLTVLQSNDAQLRQKRGGRITQGNTPSPVELSPVAAPVDVFIRAPQDPDDRRLGQLAAALSGLAPGLERLAELQSVRMADAQQQQNEDDLLAGERAFDSARVEFNKAIRDGVISEASSPFFQRGYQRASLRAMANQYGERLQAEWDGIKHSLHDDPDGFAKFASDFHKQFMESGALEGYEDKEVVRTFMPATESYRNATQNWYTQERMREMEERRRELLAAEIEQLLQVGVSEFGDHNFQMLAQGINGLLNAPGEAVWSGMNPRDANAIAAQAIARTALSQEDESLLQLLDAIQTPGGSFGNSAAGRALKEEVTDKISDRRWAQYQRAYTLREREKAEIADRMFAEAAQMLAAGESPIEFAVQIARYNPSMAGSIMSLDAAFKRSQQERMENDPMRLYSAMAEIYNGNIASPVDLMNYAAANTFTAAEFNFVNARMNEHLDSPDEFKRFIDTPTVKNLLRSTASIIRGGDEFSIGMSTENAVAASQWEYDMMSWIRRQIDAQVPTETIEADLKTRSDTFLQNYLEESPSTVRSRYYSPETTFADRDAFLEDLTEFVNRRETDSLGTGWSSMTEVQRYALINNIPVEEALRRLSSHFNQ